MNAPMRSMALAALLVVPVLLAGCGGSGGRGDQDPEALKGVEWQLASAESEGDADLAAASITLEFTDDTLGGFSGVNRYSAGYTADGKGALTIEQPAGTLMAGPEPAMAAEQEYLKLLPTCDGYAVEGTTLTLYAGDAAVLTYTAAQPVDLSGTSWLVTGYNNGKEAVTSVVAGSELTLEFGADGQVTGSGGVNAFNGTYEYTPDTVKIGPLATTKMAGPQELMDQEGQYLSALQAATVWKVTRGALELHDDQGALQVTATAR
ncbi:MAG: META domain-containing protein [Coriobacteriia bacterium]|nr:META domain-containing protein [Coriobacteriia bacterium]